MFQLIVAVISIVLVAALAIASIYYGGEAFNKSSLKAGVTTLVNGGQQIAGAQALYRTDNSGVNAVTIESLVTGTYLAAIPNSSKISGGWNDTIGNVAYAPVNPTAVADVCLEADKQAGVATPRTAFTDTAIPAGQQFGCYTAGGAVVFGYKL